MQLWAKLKRLARLQRITLVLFVAMIVNSVMDYTIGYQILGGDLLGVLFGVALFALILTFIRPLARRIVWRVRNRLLVTYLLFGIVPLLLIAAMLAVGTFVLFGQIAANMVGDEIQLREEAAHAAAYGLALAALSG